MADCLQLDGTSDSQHGSRDTLYVWHANRPTALKRKGVKSVSPNSRSTSKRKAPVSRKARVKPREPAVKQWSPLLANPRRRAEGFSYDSHDKLAALAGADTTATGGEAPNDDQEDLVPWVLNGYGVSTASWEFKVLSRFFAQEQRQRPSDSDSEAWAWLDDREITMGQSRDYGRSMNATELYESLKHSRYDHTDFKNVDQRMIFISRLTPEFVKTLAKTAWGDHMSALRDAVWRHIAMETCFRVQVPMLGGPAFHLEFHLAHLRLRDTNTHAVADGVHLVDGVGQPPLDVSFLDLRTPSGEVSPHWIYQAQDSLVIYGWSNMQWTGYAFSNTGHGASLEYEEVDDEMKPHDLSTEYGFNFDLPKDVWDAREYWIRILAFRCEFVSQEWQYLIRTVEDGVNAWRSRDPCGPETSQPSTGAHDIHTSLNRTIQIMQLLRSLRDSLSTTLRTYEQFNGPSGDISYFSDLDGRSLMALNTTKESFDKLVGLHLRLVSLDESCERFAAHLGRVLSLESNRLTAQSNQLNRDSNQLSSEAHSLSQRTHDLNERTSLLNDRIRELNEMSAQAACANQAAAAKTSRSTRVNVELLLFTTPFAMVLQYFGSEKDIFSFKRNPTTFIIATLVLMLVLRLLTLLLEHPDRILGFFRGLHVKVSNQTDAGNDSSGTELEVVSPVV
ncbi:hypothetical protein NX059_007209 [Plenodomus lindquistii]|nr:hypothetical protein NX059_007209 [Plenodomus lindquistii]